LPADFESNTPAAVINALPLQVPRAGEPVSLTVLLVLQTVVSAPADTVGNGITVTEAVAVEEQPFAVPATV
jgi:hypothetical protein